MNGINDFWTTDNPVERLQEMAAQGQTGAFYPLYSYVCENYMYQDSSRGYKCTLKLGELETYGLAWCQKAGRRIAAAKMLEVLGAAEEEGEELPLLSEEKNTASKWKEDLTSSTHKLLSLEETVDPLTRELQNSADKRATLQEELHNMKIEADRCKGQLLMTKDTVQQLTSDKGSIYQEYESMCRSLMEKERQLTELRESSERQLEDVKRQHQAEKLRLEQEKATATSQRDMTKEECNRLNEQLKQKESQLSSFGRTLQDLEAVTREKKELEDQLHRFKGSASDSKVLLEGQRKELMTLNKALAKQQEAQTRLSATNHTLQYELKTQKDAASREIHELKLTIAELTSQHENKRSRLSDNLAQLQEENLTLEASLRQSACQLKQTKHALKLETQTQNELSYRQDLARCKKQLAKVQGDLNTERSLHQITKDSRQALEEDYQRLRRQLHYMRKRNNSGTETKYGNRIEAISAILARSQTQARLFCHQGATIRDPMNSPRQNLSPRVGGYHRDHSPDTPLATVRPTDET